MYKIKAYLQNQHGLPFQRQIEVFSFHLYQVQRTIKSILNSKSMLTIFTFTSFC